MTVRQLLGLGGAAAWALAAAGIAGLDGMVEWAIAGLTAAPAMNRSLGVLDLLAGKEISTFLLGFVLLTIACAMLARAATRWLGWPLLYLGLVQFLTTTIVDLGKTPLGRLRPYEALQNGLGDHWFVGGQSFPSGHTAFYAGLFAPLILLLPRWTAVWLIVPAIVAIQRVIAHDHYLSDVSFSLGLAAVLAAALGGVVRRNRAARYRRSHSQSAMANAPPVPPPISTPGVTSPVITPAMQPITIPSTIRKPPA